MAPASIKTCASMLKARHLDGQQVLDDRGRLRLQRARDAQHLRHRYQSAAISCCAATTKASTWKTASLLGKAVYQRRCARRDLPDALVPGRCQWLPARPAFPAPPRSGSIRRYPAPIIDARQPRLHASYGTGIRPAWRVRSGLHQQSRALAGADQSYDVGVESAFFEQAFARRHVVSQPLSRSDRSLWRFARQAFAVSTRIIWPTRGRRRGNQCAQFRPHAGFR